MGLTLGGSPLSQLVERPRLRFPGAADVFERLFEAAEYRVAESSAGQFRRMATALWGGLERFASDLNDAATSELLHAWLSVEPSGTDPGFRLPTTRRVLSLADGCTASGLTTDAAREKLDELLQLGVVRRGLTLKCPACRFFDWYSLDDVGQSFECNRCRSQSTVVKARWSGGNEPDFYYDLAEVVYQALRNNAAVPIRAAAAVQARSRSFDERSEVEIADPAGTKTELDLLLIAEGRLIIGEAKRNNRLGATEQRELRLIRGLREIAERITADHILFASAVEFRDETKVLIERELSGGSATWELLEGLAGSSGD